MESGVRSEQGLWPPPLSAFQHQRWDDADGERPTTILLRHPANPFVREVSSIDGPTLRGLAYEYLVDVVMAARLRLPDRWLPALDPSGDGRPEFGWLPINCPPDGESPYRIGSLRVAFDLGANPRYQTVVLLASERVGDFVLGSEAGLRVVIHIRRLSDERFQTRITGLSATLPLPSYDLTRDADAFWTAERLGLFLDSLKPFAPFVGRTFGLEPDSIFLRGFRLGHGGDQLGGGGDLLRQVEIRGRGFSAERSGTPYEFILVAKVADHSAPRIASFNKVPLVACMSGSARVFRCDPASQGGPDGYHQRRPTRKEAVLDLYRVPEEEPVPLEIAGEVTVVQTWFVLGDDPSGGPKSVPLPRPPPVRSNDFSAVSTLRNLRQLFERFELYGITPEDYFQLARLPIKGFYRSGVRPGPGKDGQTVNARVLPEGWPVTALVPPTAGDRPLLQVHLALGELFTRARKPWDRIHRSPAEPLGLAADPRWMWHEIGHILLMAALGELEFRFAHSMGDALAAIVADPFSRLADHPDWRGYTFPWVFLPRRHDRCVLHGWGWSGSLGHPLRQLPDQERLRRKGYWTEQILSTSLFRLYRCLGGDTVVAGTTEADRAARNRASDYSVYLIFKALQVLGDPRIVPANKADQFVAALSDADEGTETWPLGGGNGITPWIGGCATKVIRWAFEAQGMYREGEDVVLDAPGLPPAVDIYIKDRRPEVEVQPGATIRHGPGAYVPVSLDWAGLDADPAADAVPQWFADAGAIRQTNGDVEVSVANRGGLVAQGVTVSVWWREWPPGQTPPPWHESDWTSAGTSAAKNVAPGQPETFGPFVLPTSPARYLVLAQTTCVDDRANTDPVPSFACTREPTPLNELVSGDNNLGLAVIQVP